MTGIRDSRNLCVIDRSGAGLAAVLIRLHEREMGAAVGSGRDDGGVGSVQSFSHFRSLSACWKVVGVGLFCSWPPWEPGAKRSGDGFDFLTMDG